MAIVRLIAFWLLASLIVYGLVAQGKHWLFPDLSQLKNHYPVVEDKVDGKLLIHFEPQKPPHWRSYHQISKRAITAILMSEDGHFFSHKGLDPEAIQLAMKANQKAGKILRGGSTITQQVVKNLFLSAEKTWIRKIREAFLALELERVLKKKQILELYLNIVEWGPHIFGIERASQHYFKKDPSALTAREGAILAYLLPNPVLYQKNITRGSVSTNYGHRRVDSIMEKLWRTGHISDEEFGVVNQEVNEPKQEDVDVLNTEESKEENTISSDEASPSAPSEGTLNP